MIRFDAPKFPRKNRGRLLVISRKKGERERETGDELKDSSGCDSHWELLADPDPESHPCERERERKRKRTVLALLDFILCV